MSIQMRVRGGYIVMLLSAIIGMSVAHGDELQSPNQPDREICLEDHAIQGRCGMLSLSESARIRHMLSLIQDCAPIHEKLQDLIAHNQIRIADEMPRWTCDGNPQLKGEAVATSETSGLIILNRKYFEKDPDERYVAVLRHETGHHLYPAGLRIGTAANHTFFTTEQMAQKHGNCFKISHSLIELHQRADNSIAHSSAALSTAVCTPPVPTVLDTLALPLAAQFSTEPIGSDSLTDVEKITPKRKTPEPKRLEAGALCRNFAELQKLRASRKKN